MTGLLIIIIYITYISLGLPDSMIGASWPAIMEEMGIGLEMLGAISLISTVGTILASLCTTPLLKKFGTAKLTAFSIILTATALLGYSISNHVFFLIILTIPLGMGAGAIDTIINNYVALNFKPKHMNFLHSFWGVGVTTSPLVLAAAINSGGTWRTAYLIVGIIQLVISAIVLLSIPLWKKADKKSEVQLDYKEPKSLKETVKVKGVIFAALCFAFYCSLEFTFNNYGNSYLVGTTGVTVEKGATIVSLFYLGITLGRISSGFAVSKLKSSTLVRMGEILTVVGIIWLGVSRTYEGKAVAYLLIGLGNAPIFPCIMNETPRRFGMEYSQSAISLQVAFAYLGGALMAPIFGVLGKMISISILPIYLMIFAVLLIVTYEILLKKTKMDKFI